MKDEFLECYNSFDVQAQIDELYNFYQELDNKLKNPIQYGLNEDHIILKNGAKYVNLTKFFRMIDSLKSFHASIKRLNEFLVSIEFFQNKIEFIRTSNPLSEEFTTKFFLNVGIDSIRSALDIYVNFIISFFALRDKECGFSYRKFIKPLKGVNPELSERINTLYKSEAFKYIKELRDSAKHVGDKNVSMTFEKLGAIKLEGVTPFNHLEVAYKLKELFFEFYELIKDTVLILKKYKFGYNSPEDMIALLQDDQKMKDLGRLKNLSQLGFLLRQV